MHWVRNQWKKVNRWNYKLFYKVRWNKQPYDWWLRAIWQISKARTKSQWAEYALRRI